MHNGQFSPSAHDADDAPATRWLIRQRTMLPDPVDGLLERGSLGGRFDLTRRRITVVNAPAGFGKTTALAETCRRLRGQGGIAAWVSVEEDDDPFTLIGYILLAFSDAGLQLPEGGAASSLAAWDGEGLSDARLQWLLRAIEVRGEPCVLAFDEVDRLRVDETLQLLNGIMRIAPPNLHLAMAYREHPPQLEIASSIVDGSGTVVSVEEMRFEKSEVVRFFDGQLSAEQLAAVLAASRGWPIALQLQRNHNQLGHWPEETDEVALNWMWTSLFRGLGSEDRDFVMDVCLFEWADGELLDGVLGPGSAKRLEAMPTLAGLVQPVGDSHSFRLHALLRRLCGDWLYRAHPERFRRIHRGIAVALAERGKVLKAMHHADQAEDPHLAARVLEDAGGIRLWLRLGIRPLRRADKLLPQEVVDEHPRLLLARCALLAANGQFEKAQHMLDRAAAREPDAALDPDLLLDGLIMDGVRALHGCNLVTSPRLKELITAYRGIADDPGADRLVRGAVRYGLGLFEQQRGGFDAARTWIAKSKRDLGAASDYLTMYANFHEGTIAFASGHPTDALASFHRGFETSSRQFAADTGPLAAWRVCVAEINLERNQTSSLEGWSVDPEYLGGRGAWLDVFVAAAHVMSELALARGDSPAAVDAVRQGFEFARRTRRPAMQRALAALYAGVLVRTGRVADADWLWRSEKLPVQAADCAVLGTQTWREMECICRARAWLLFAEGDLDASREVADAFAASARRAGLKRSLIWALALSAAIAGQAGDPERAFSDLLEYWKLWMETDYRLALIVLEPHIQPLLEASPPDRQSLAAELAGILAAARPQVRTDPVPNLTAREYEVLRRLGHARDKEIASALGISTNGVRYHVKKIFRKLDVNGRREAAQRARELGIAGNLADPPVFVTHSTATAM